VVLKPSELTPSTSDVLREMIEKTFYKEFIAVIQGDADTCGMLLKHRFDHIFFTGSTRVGKLVCQAAAGNLTPVTLELGGKSPCIVTNSADLTVAAKRIVWGKLLNAGQTCVAPDYVLVHKDVKGTFVERLKEAIIWFYGTSIRTNPDFPRIVNDRHFDRLEALLDNTQLAVGGNTDKRALYIAPTLIDSVNWDDPVMQEEIFGPLLPILTYETLDEAVTKINEREKPLALYLFTSDKREIRKIETRCHFGGGCINDTISHLLNPYLPFGGVGFSGTGSYHGKYGFDAFSHYKGMVNRKTWPDLPLRYAPYGGKGRLAFLRRFFG
jgi:aldehyde dehydrogenase (NAD+)